MPSPDACTFGNQIRKHCFPAYEVSALNEVQIQGILHQMLTLAEWDSLFAGLKEGIVPQWLLYKENVPLVPHQALTLGAPKNIEKQVASDTSFSDKAGLIFTIPALSFDIEELQEMDEDTKTSFMPCGYLHDSLRTYNRRFTMLKDCWTKAFQEIESNYLVMASDIKALETVPNDFEYVISRPASVAST